MYRKKLTIELYYRQFNDIQESLNKCIKQIKRGDTNNHRELIDEVLLDWKIESSEIPEARLENINGVDCIVIKSSIGHE